MEKRLKCLIFAIIACVAVAVLLMQPLPQPKALEEQSLSSRIDSAITRGIDFLYKNQLEWGEFRTDACKDAKMQECYFESSPFITTFVLYSIQDLHDKKAGEMTNKSLEFLLSEQGAGGIWRCASSKNKNVMDPDLDDTSLVSFALKTNNWSFQENTALIERTRDVEGRFLTWIMEGGDNDIDCGVNTNVLLYLGKNDANVCQYVNGAIVRHQSCSLYYPNELVLFYLVSRAFVNNVTCFDEIGGYIINATQKLQEKDWSFGNDLNTSLAINVLLNFEYAGSEVDKGINQLLQTQNADGSWARDIFFVGGSKYYGFGSKELTTALTLEALEKYRILNSD